MTKLNFLSDEWNGLQERFRPAAANTKKNCKDKERPQLKANRRPKWQGIIWALIQGRCGFISVAKKSQNLSKLCYLWAYVVFISV